MSSTTLIKRALKAAAEAQRATAEALEALAAGLDAESSSSAAAPTATVDLLDVRQAATRLGMSTSWVYKAVEAGRLTKVQIGNRVRFRAADLDAFIAARQLSALE
jgi:excisionase family DNA binding protein